MPRASEELIGLVKEHSLKFGDFVLASGLRSHFYVDCRDLTLTSVGADAVGREFLDAISGLGWPCDAVAGLTVGADPIVAAMLVHAYQRQQSLVGGIVRKEAKQHGRGKAIEGPLAAGHRVVIVEDVTTTGQSALQAARAVADVGCSVSGVLTLLDREQGAADTIAAEGFPFERLMTLADLGV